MILPASNSTGSACKTSLTFAEGAGIPITTTMLGKSVVSETHPLFVGLYGAMGREEVTSIEKRLPDHARRS